MATINSHFRSKHMNYIKASNLTNEQKIILNYIRANENLKVLPADKNLGPYSMELLKYIKLAHDHYFPNKKVYKRLTKKKLIQECIMQ